MLVLSRHDDEVIVITTPTGERLRIKVVAVEGWRKRVRLGFEGPQFFAIHREERRDAIDGKTA